MAVLTQEDVTGFSAAVRELTRELRKAQGFDVDVEAVQRACAGEPMNAAKVSVGNAGEVTMKPRVGEIVMYRARTRDYQLPAIVTANVESLDRRGVIRGHVPDITGEDHVHLNVQTAGSQVVYQEYNIPYSKEPIPGTWGWR